MSLHPASVPGEIVPLAGQNPYPEVPWLAWEESARPYLKSKLKAKSVWGMAQVVKDLPLVWVPKYKAQYCQKTRQNLLFIFKISNYGNSCVNKVERKVQETHHLQRKVGFYQVIRTRSEIDHFKHLKDVYKWMNNSILKNQCSKRKRRSYLVLTNRQLHTAHWWPLEAVSHTTSHSDVVIKGKRDLREDGTDSISTPRAQYIWFHQHPMSSVHLVLSAPCELSVDNYGTDPMDS
jgi:hypothetical protein